MNHLLYRNFLVALILFVSFGHSWAQSRIEPDTKNKKALEMYREAEKQLKVRQFFPAVELLKGAVDKDPKFAEAWFMLGSTLKIIADYANSEVCFRKVTELKPEDRGLSPAYYFQSQMLYKRGEYELALPLAEKYLSFNSNHEVSNEEAKRVIQSCRFAIEAKKNPVPFTPRPLTNSINRYMYQYFPVLTADKRFLIFTVRNSPGFSAHEDIYISEFNGKFYANPQSISPNINSPQNEGTCSISADGRTLVFTSCGRKDGFGSCDLYISYRTGNEWSKPENMGEHINSPAWESQPSLSADGKTIYFSSTRKGGMGNEDIWMSEKSGNVWALPVNLGPNINTPYSETSPCVHPSDRTIYFASNGHIGMGGYDLFKAEKTDTLWDPPVNLGFPINQHQDESGIFICADNSKGYYSVDFKKGPVSERSMLYEFDIPESVKSLYSSTYAKGKVYDAVTKLPLEAEIEIYDLRSFLKTQILSSDPVTGEYLAVLTEGREYAVYVNKKGYLFKSLAFNYTNKETFEPLSLDIYLEPLRPGATISLNNLFFESGKYKLQDKSDVELFKIITFLNNNEKSKIEISGHTDNVGKPEDNLKLSTNRAKEVYDFLAQAGIPLARISYKGYADKKPVAKNDTEEGRAQNRRIEFTIK
ncbi:MAG: OmpA family protein [Cytophagales bacterium]|nr:OmpA family protein [Cytophagales bacterium]